jgi:hypothetical protein
LDPFLTVHLSNEHGQDEKDITGKSEISGNYLRTDAISDDYRRISMNTDSCGTAVTIGIAVGWWWVCIYKRRVEVAYKGK